MEISTIRELENLIEEVVNGSNITSIKYDVKSTIWSIHKEDLIADIECSDLQQVSEMIQIITKPDWGN